MIFGQNIWNELREQYELSVRLYEGPLGWAKVIDGDLQDVQVYFATTLELLNKIIANISDSPDRLQQTIKKMEEVGDGSLQQDVIHKLKQHTINLIAFRDQTIKLITIGKQIKKGEESTYLKQIAQHLYDIAETMNNASTDLKAALITMRGLDID
jgi:hypothetical protein